MALWSSLVTAKIMVKIISYRGFKSETDATEIILIIIIKTTTALQKYLH
jgi:hypothetical protein